jgi:hypothetical protein
MVTKNITSIEKLDAYWQSKYQRLKNMYRKRIGILQNKLTNSKKRASVDYKIIHKFAEHYPSHWEIYKELHSSGIETKGILRPKKTS